MKFLVVGPGAMGCLFAARLKMAGNDVTLLDYIEERAAQINTQGIIVEGVSGEYTISIHTVTHVTSTLPDLVLICVKAYKTKEASRTVRPWVSPETVVATLQNGVGNVEILEEMFGKERIIAGVTSEGATVLAPGKIRHAGRGETFLGAMGEEGVSRRVENLVQAFAEAVAVARAKNIRLPHPDYVKCVLEVCRATAGNIASMLQDVLKEKQTEVDFINGAIVREGDKAGISTPVNFLLTSLVQAIQQNYQKDTGV